MSVVARVQAIEKNNEDFNIINRKSPTIQGQMKTKNTPLKQSLRTINIFQLNENNERWDPNTWRSCGGTANSGYGGRQSKGGVDGSGYLSADWGQTQVSGVNLIT